jgi:hypothetical protein
LNGVRVLLARSLRRLLITEVEDISERLQSVVRWLKALDPAQPKTQPAKRRPRC